MMVLFQLKQYAGEGPGLGGGSFLCAVRSRTCWDMGPTWSRLYNAAFVKNTIIITTVAFSEQ